MNKHEYICRITETVAMKAHCTKRQVGAVFVNQEYEILATGYNATPKGFPRCTVFHGPDEQCTECAHAEQNAITQAAKRGTALAESILYCTYAPCKICARMLINLGIKSVRYKEGNLDGGLDLLNQAEIITETWENFCR